MSGTELLLGHCRARLSGEQEPGEREATEKPENQRAYEPPGR